MKGHANPTIRSTDEVEQVGPQMHKAIRRVAKKTYPSKNRLAISVGPNGSQDYGYRIVNRCTRKNLLKVHPGHEKATPQGLGAVVLTDKGARYLNETEDMDLDPDDYVGARMRWRDGEWTRY